MATIPGVFILGDQQVQGGKYLPVSEVDSAGAVDGITGLLDQKMMRVVPDDGTTGASASASLSWWPWFDSNAGEVYTVAAGATGTTVTVTPDPGWTVNEWAGFTVTNSRPSPGYGFENNSVAVVSNTSDTITVASWATTPTSGTGLWFNEGQFTDYHPVGGWRTYTEIVGALTAFRGGSSVLQGHKGIGYDAGLIRELYENVWDTSPYFVVAKAATTNTVATLAGGGAPQTSIETYIAKVEAAFAAKYPTDTLSWDYLLLDSSQADVSAGDVTTIQADTETVIAWLLGASALNNASLRTLLVNHDPLLRNVTQPAKTYAVNQAHNAAAAADDAVRAVDLAGLNLPLRGADAASGVMLWQPNENQEFYATSVYANEAPKAMRQSIELWEAGAAPGVDNSIPVYIMIGDSIDVGNVSLGYAALLDSDIYPNTGRSSNQKIWNRGSQAVETYAPNVNSQTSGSTVSSASAGPDYSLMHHLEQRHPDTGFVLIKRASSSSALASEASAYDGNENGGRWLKSVADEHYTELTADVDGCFHAINTVLGKQGELMGIFVNLGTNDTGVSGYGDIFAANLEAFVDDLRADFGTHTSGKATPIIWRMPQLNLAGRVYADLVTVRAALTSLAQDDAQFIAQNVDDLDRTTDNLHETAESNIERGRRIDDEPATVALPNC